MPFLKAAFPLLMSFAVVAAKGISVDLGRKISHFLPHHVVFFYSNWPANSPGPTDGGNAQHILFQNPAQRSRSLSCDTKATANAEPGWNAEPYRSSRQAPLQASSKAGRGGGRGCVADSCRSVSEIGSARAPFLVHGSKRRPVMITAKQNC